MNRVIIYGDLHGCLEEFVSLRAKIMPSVNDREIIIGDILDRGSSVELLRYIRKNKIESILGNHEDKYLRYKKHHDLFIEKGVSIPISFPDDKIKIFNSLSYEDFAYLQSLPYFMKINNLTLVHGGLTNKIDLDNLSNKDKKVILRLRYLQEDNVISHTAHKNIYNKHWANLYNGNQGVVIYGHEVYDEVKYDKFAIGIDTGCVYGNKLTALVVFDTNNVLKNHEIVQINSKNYLL